MSSFRIKATNKATGEEVEVWCIDDYFGKHKYGYILNMAQPVGTALTEKEFEELYDVQEM